MATPRSHHDRVFRWAFSRPEGMRSLIEVALPGGLRGLEPGTLQRAAGDFVADDLTELQGDLVFSARFQGREAFLYTILEHQRYDNRLATFRALRGSTHLWEWWLREHPKATRLPAVVPILVSQLERPWTGARRLSELVDYPDEALATIRAHQAELELVVFDLAEHSHAELARVGDLVARLALALMKGRAEGVSPEEVLILHRDAGHAVFGEPLLADEQKALGAYMMAAWHLNGERYVEMIRKSVGVDLHQEVLDLLREEGVLMNARETLLSLLEARYGPVSAEHRARIDAATAPELKAWTLRVLDAKTASDVFA